MNRLSATALGPTGYRDGLRLQEAMVGARAAGHTGDWLLFPEHPNVLTIGRAPSAGSLKVSREQLERLGIEVFEVARGGDITWHGPGQLVGYAVCDLDRRGRDLHRFLRGMEQALIQALAQWRLQGERVEGRTGVWVEGRKIASIGIAVRRWVSYHGFALNVRPDLEYFNLIHPCGLRGIEMASLGSRLGDSAPTLAVSREVVARAFADVMGYDAVCWKPPLDAWSAAGVAPGSGPADTIETSAA